MGTEEDFILISQELCYFLKAKSFSVVSDASDFHLGKTR